MKARHRGFSAVDDEVFQTTTRRYGKRSANTSGGQVAAVVVEPDAAHMGDVVEAA
jgi:hypothetical protein